MKASPNVLIVAGSDSSGGAGILRDVETVAAFGLKSCAAITAVTAQTHDRVVSVSPVRPSTVADQMRAALSANQVGSIKIGMLASAETVTAVAEIVAQYPDIPVVLDPVLASSSGALLLEPPGMSVMRRALFPLCDLVTPNLPELGLLSGNSSLLDVAQACKEILDTGTHAVLVKGGHAEGPDANDILYRAASAPKVFSGKRIPGTIRGTGCMLASAIAANLALGRALVDAIEIAKANVTHQFETNSSKFI